MILNRDTRTCAAACPARRTSDRFRSGISPRSYSPNPRGHSRKRTRWRLAADRVLPRIQERKAQLRGEVVLLRGNTRALERKVRYIDADLNRQWAPDSVRVTAQGTVVAGFTSERSEQGELLVTIRDAVSRARSEVYFLDLHTTSAHGKPFATVGDTLRNRRFALRFPVTIVLGLEEQINGTLLEYINNLGAITMGFEAGQHEAITSVDHHEAVIWNATVAAGNFLRQDVAELDNCRSLLKHAGGGRRVVEVRHRHAITPEDGFQMEPGFRNFQPVQRGQVLARERAGEITAWRNRSHPATVVSGTG